MSTSFGGHAQSYEIATIPIRYDGLDAEQHKIDLMLLGESIQGIGRVLATVGHFAVTGQYAKQKQACCKAESVQSSVFCLPGFLTVLGIAKKK